MQQALAEGEPIPPEVLAEYPDLAKKAAPVRPGAVEKAKGPVIAQLKERGFDGTVDRLQRGEITLRQAQDELRGEVSHIPASTPTELNPADFAAELKGRGVGRQESWSRWVQRTSLKPGMDAKDWYAIYDSVTAASASQRAARKSVTPAPEAAKPVKPAKKAVVSAGKEPWKMTREEAGADDRIVLGGGMGETVARVGAEGRIILSDGFFEHDEATRRQIWEHEIAHGAIDPAEDRFWRLVDSGVIGQYNEAKMKWEGIAPGKNPEETLTELVRRARAGKPVPPEVLAEYPDLAEKPTAEETPDPITGRLPIFDFREADEIRQDFIDAGVEHVDLAVQDYDRRGREAREQAEQSLDTARVLAQREAEAFGKEYTV